MNTVPSNTSNSADTLGSKWVHYYMRMAELTATLSTARRLQVGSVLVKNTRVLATGYNGTPSGWDNTCEDVLPDGTLKTKPIVLHSEMNCLMHVARSTESSLGSTMFCTHAPCLDCAKAVYQAGVQRFYWRDSYRDSSGLEFLGDSGVHVTNYNYP